MYAKTNGIKEKMNSVAAGEEPELWQEYEAIVAKWKTYESLEANDDDALKVNEAMIKKGEDWALVPNVRTWKFVESLK